MARPSALDVLTTMDQAWRAEYAASLAAAQSFARRLPLVRVVVPDASATPGHAERLRREEMQIEDIFLHGRLKPGHESEKTHKDAARLAVDHSLYFHAGRTHPDYGRLALVFRELPDDDGTEATPFGLGGLLCPGSGDAHATGSCTSPVAHDLELDQVSFVCASRWTSGWRDQAGRFLAAYFGAELDRYFLPAATGKPKRLDPAGIYSDDSGSRDWRSWTVEVRLACEVNLFEALDRGALEAWAIDTKLEDRLEDLVVQRGTYPWWNKLRRASARRIPANGLGMSELFAQVDREVRDRCLL